MRKFAWLLLAAALLVYAQSARATILGSIRGIVHDPAAPARSPTRRVKLQSSTSDWSRTAQTNSDGEFEFDAVPLGEYEIIGHACRFRRRHPKHRRWTPAARLCCTSR